jgi:hypothetical protein
MSRVAAELLSDKRYACSSSSVSDYELRGAPPRDLHKIITLCSVYGLQFESVMSGMGVDIFHSGTEPMPEQYVFRRVPLPTPGHSDASGRTAGFLEELLNDCRNEIPFFLRDLSGYFSDSRHPSIDDFFWIGGDRDPLHPYLADGLVVMVNRRRKTPFHLLSKPVWEQPIYIILPRDGNYLAVCCGIEDDKLVIYPYGPKFHPSAEYRLHRDAEIVGQVVAIARRLL